jgi:hypothetical protein
VAGARRSPNNRIPTQLTSPLAKIVYALAPLPTLPNVNPLVEPNLNYNYANRNELSKLSLRGIDPGQIATPEGRRHVRLSKGVAAAAYRATVVGIHEQRLRAVVE